MNSFCKLTLLLSSLFFCALAHAQTTEPRTAFVVDSIFVKEDPEEGDELKGEDVSDITIIKNKDSLRTLGYAGFDILTYVFTKAYRNRSEELKRIPSTKQMERKDGIWMFRGAAYSGKFIDYYYSGKKSGEGIFVNGVINGTRIEYYQNGNISYERNYKAAIADGWQKEYYEDGVLKQQGVFANGKEEGVWDMYFPNGQLKQRANFKNGVVDGEAIIYYSTGKVKIKQFIKDGKAIPDKQLEKLEKIIQNGHVNSKEGEYDAAIKNYSKAIELDSTYAEAYFARGTARLNNFQFDASITDFDKALQYEPLMSYALSNRAFARIRKYQFGSSRTLSKNNEITVLASKDKVPVPAAEREKICQDLTKAIQLGDKKTQMIREALADYCGN